MALTLSEEAISRLPTDERESVFCEWFKVNFNNGALKVKHHEAWRMLRLFGLNVLKNVLAGKDHSAKPFGDKGCSYLNALVCAMCSNMGKDLSGDVYIMYTSEVEAYLRQHVLLPMNEKSGALLLQEFVDAWSRHCILTKWLWKLFYHLDIAYTSVRNKMSVTSVSLRLFFSVIFVECKAKLIGGLLAHIDQDRTDNINGARSSSMTIVKECVRIFELMGMAEAGGSVNGMAAALKLPLSLSEYAREFEVPFLAASKVHYHRLSSKWIAELSLGEYVEKCSNSLEFEGECCSRWLSPGTKPKLIKVVLEEFLLPHQDTLLDATMSIVQTHISNFNASSETTTPSLLQKLFVMCRTSTTIAEDCGTVNSIFGDIIQKLKTQNVDKLSKLGNDLVADIAAKYRACIIDLGRVSTNSIKSQMDQYHQHLEGAKKPSLSDPEFIESMLQLHRKISSISCTVFQSHSLIMKAQRLAFMDILNEAITDQFLPVDMLAYYCDRILKGSVKITHSEMESVLDQCVVLLSHLHDKDIFAEIYRSQLAKRLLNHRSVSTEAERRTISKMKLECGSSFTSKFEGMLNDFSLTDDAGSEFIKEYPALETSISVQVLTGGFWPQQLPHTGLLPPIMQSSISKFNSWYQEKNPSRNLKWIHTLGEVVVKASYGKRSYEISLTTLQGVLLSVFDKGGPAAASSSTSTTTSTSIAPLTFLTIQELTGITNVDVLKRLLHSVSCGKYKLLTKHPASKVISIEDVFSPNSAFSTPLRKIRVPMSSLEEVPSVTKIVTEERGFAVDAAVVRVMKARKVLAHQELQMEVLRQLSYFQPSQKLIKKQIESLLERDYLERDSDDEKLYKYVA